MSDPATSPRELYEQNHRAWLHPAAVSEAQAGGRKFPESEHPYRTCFQRDRDRIVHCSAFRRLDFKTQVFVPHEDDHFRTRLTHTLEVAQIGRTLARALRLNEDLVETVALAHDLGHPPFGHCGEAVLNELMADHGRFEHNRQSLRVVDYLEHPYPQFRGLNLSQVVRECLARHQTRYDVPGGEEFDPRLQSVLEGQLVDLADELAYTSADLEDSLAAGCISVEELAELPLWRQAWQAAEQDCPGARPIHQRIRACKAVLAAMADDVLAHASRQMAELALASPQAVRMAPRRCMGFSPAMAPAVAQLQDFLMQRVYLRGENAQREQEAGRLIRELCSAYLAQPSLLPPRYQQRIEAQGLHRVICDYIAGMTDRFCRLEHRKIVGPS
ncbi:MAG: deoxyguanosinetriphosphate triphosphohydrolase [Phycisphaerae bacterium]|jgi:dGTPase